MSIYCWKAHPLLPFTKQNKPLASGLFFSFHRSVKLKAEITEVFTMKKSVLFLAVAALFLSAFLIGCTESQPNKPEAAPSSPVPTEAPVMLPKDKTEKYLFSGKWVSDDEQTVVPILVHLYEDGSLVLEAHENRAGSWTENDDGSLSILIGGDSYTGKYSEFLKTMFFRYEGKIGDEEFSVQLTVAPDPAKVAEENNQAMIESIRASEPKEAYTGKGGEVIFYGGSNFQKWTTLEADLPGYPVVNKSIGGSNDPIRREFIEERVYNRNPAVVFYMSSSNDWTSGQSKDEIISYKQGMFDEMAEKLPDTVFVILSATPNPLRYFGEYHDGMVAVDNWTKSYCAGKQNFEFLDVVPALSLNSGAEVKPDLWQSDRLHLNEDGYAILTELIMNELKSVEETYQLTFNAPEQIEEDGDAQRENWTMDWTSFTGWTGEAFDGKDISYQLTGHWEMDGANAMAFEFLANLYTDGSLRITQYSLTRGRNDYFGYWTLRNIESGNRITLTTVLETPIGGEGELVAHKYTYKFFEESGLYSFSFDFGIIPASYFRAVDLSGSEAVQYPSADLFISTFSAE